jgi:dTDP-4-amino-4,6-dideoxygalactose transaminase
MDPVMNIAARHGLKVIEDAAQAHGAEYRGRRVGSIGDMACFSFYPGKNLGAYGDGGAVVTNNESYAKMAKMYANHGRISKYDHEFEGVNSRLDTLQAAILDVKLKHLDSWTGSRIANAENYSNRLKSTEFQLPAESDGIKPVFHLYVIRREDVARDKFMEFLKSAEISSGIHYPIALPFLKAYAYLKHKKEEFPEAYKASQQVVSLPMFPELNGEQIEYICSRIGEFVR